MSSLLDSQHGTTTSLDYFDTLSLYRVCERLAVEAEDLGPARVRYESLITCCREIRSQHRMNPDSVAVAAMAVDHESEKQLRFVEAIKALGIVTNVMDYRWTHVGRVGEIEDDRKRPVSSLAPHASYLLGLLAGRSEIGRTPDVVMVTGVFDVCPSMLDLAIHRNGKPVLAFFKSFLDKRWAAEGLFDLGFPISFVDLELYAPELIGVDLASRHRDRLHRSIEGLSRV